MDSKWEVNIRRYHDVIEVHVRNGNLRINDYWDSNVVAPNFIERLFGITLKSKLDKAVKKQQRIADKLNKRDKLFEQGVAEYYASKN